MKRAIAILFTAAPFVAGMIAAFSPRRDFRILAMAVAATVTARVVVAVSPAARPGIGAGAACALSAIAAGMTAMALGAWAPFGVVAVAVVLAGFASAGAALARRA